MKIPTPKFTAVVAGFLLAAPLAFAADSAPMEGQGRAVVTVLQGQEIPGGIPQQALQLEVA